MDYPTQDATTYYKAAYAVMLHLHITFNFLTSFGLIISSLTLYRGEDVEIQYTVLYKMLLLSCLCCYSAIGHQVEPCKFAASYLLMFLRSKWKRSDTYLMGIGGTEASKISD